VQPIPPDAAPTRGGDTPQRPAARTPSAQGGLVVPLRFSGPETRTLTIRERRALELTANGLELGEIARHMSTSEAEFVSEETVKSYQRSGRAKLGARSLVHAIALAVHQRLIQLDA